MKNFLLQLFTWWHGQTFGTRFFTWRKGVFVGEDEAGNRYYTERNGRRRWVIYKGEVDASAIPPGWHGWMHHRVDEAPSDEDYYPKRWQRPHRPNMTGTAMAYRPAGSILRPEHTPAEQTDYKAWTPGD